MQPRRDRQDSHKVRIKFYGDEVIPVITDNKIAQKIRQRRRQIIVHSILYYRFDTPIIDDFTFDKWCNELIQLQCKYPKISKRIELYDDFKDFTHASGFNLQSLNNPIFISIARRLVNNGV